MVQKVNLETIEVVAKPQDEMRLPSSTPAQVGTSAKPSDVASLRQTAPWVSTPSSLRGDYQLKHAFDASLKNPDGAIFSDYQLVYFRSDGQGVLIRQSLVGNYGDGSELQHEVTVYGSLQSISIGDSPGALLTLEEMKISESARVPPLARVIVEREGVLVEVEGPPSQVADLLEVTRSFLES